MGDARMTADELDRIERELGLKLPGSYREFMQSGEFGEGSRGPQDLTGVGEEVIAMNKDLRMNGFFGAKWPEHYIAIGDDGAGDYYFTDAQRDRPAVFLADHELTTNKDCLVVSKKYQYETFLRFWEFLEENRLATEKWLKRRWWQKLIRPL